MHIPLWSKLYVSTTNSDTGSDSLSLHFHLHSTGHTPGVVREDDTSVMIHGNDTPDVIRGGGKYFVLLNILEYGDI